MDANILLYAEDSLSPFHERARIYWDGLLSGSRPVGLAWESILAFIRISTNPRVFKKPLFMEEAVERVQSWIGQPCVLIVQPTGNHWERLRACLKAGRAASALVSDAHLAALAMEHGADLSSSDSDFARFPGLKWRDPLKN